MGTWKSYASSLTIAWLLEEENLAVRARTLCDLFDFAPDSPEVRQARERELEGGLTRRILAKMEPGGWWGKPEDFYMRSKYHGTVWSFLLLAEMGCAFEEERFRAAGEFLLAKSQRPDNGGFTYATPRPDGGARPAAFPCLTGNLVWALLQAGWDEDPRVARGLDWLAGNQFLSDGLDDPAPAVLPRGMEKALFEKCWGSHTCMNGVIKNLKALAAYPEGRRTPPMRAAIRAGVDFLLRHRLVYSSHDPDRLANTDFGRLSFPLLWRSDALEMLDVLLSLGVRDEALLPALHLILSKRSPEGRWTLEQSFNGRMLARVEKDGAASKWVTLRALTVLKKACEAGLPLPEIKPA